MKKSVIGLSGTHGTGKSTIMNGVAEYGFAVNSAQLSRTVQSLLGWTSLKQVEQSEESMWCFQNKILDIMIERDNDINESGQVTLAERSPVDLWAYAQLWCKRFGIDVGKSSTAKSYYNRCNSALGAYKAILVLNQSQSIPFVAENNRADLESRDFVDKAIKQFIKDSNVYSYEFQNVEKMARLAEAANFLTFTKTL